MVKDIASSKTKTFQRSSSADGSARAAWLRARSHIADVLQLRQFPNNRQAE